MSGLLVALTGWFLLCSYLYYEYQEYGSDFLKHFYSPYRSSETIFHVAVFLIPLITTYLGYLIHQRRLMEEKHRQSEKKYRELLETANSVILTWDTEGNLTFLNDFAERFFGFSRTELLGRNVVGTIVPATESSGRDLALLMEEIRRDPDRFKDNENENITKGGLRVWVRWANKAILDEQGSLIGILSIGNDITERKLAAEELRMSEERFRTLSEAAFEAIVITEDGIFLDVNRQMCDMLGYALDELRGMPVVDVIAPEDREIVHHNLSESPYESRLLRKDGSIVIVESRARHFMIRDRKVRVTVLRDITKRKREEEALHLTRFTVDNVADAVYWMDSKARIVEVNETACSTLGYTREELLGLTVMDIDPDFTEDAWLVAWKALKAEGKLRLETRHRTKDGRIIPVEIMANYLSFGGKELDCAFARDISHRKRAEEDLLKTQKLESLGILAGGIAHDFNNILTAILGNISLVRMKMRPDGPQFKWLEEAERACSHAKELTQQLLTFAKGGSPVKNTVPIEQFIRDSVSFAMRGSKIKCDFSFGEESRAVDVDEGQMGQVFNNLLINACQAMPGGGKIMITAQNIDISAKDSLPLPEGKYVKISIADQGTGISEEYLHRIFDPYFTTKQTGSGLGLSIVYSVVKNHNGHINVESRLGVGTTFNICLPASAEKVVEKEPAGEQHIFGKGRVLVMDDEELVREVAGEMLKIMGYEVEFAPDGADAISLYRAATASSRPFDVVIMDLTVPGGMGGEETIQKIREVDPGVKAIVSSGYSQDPIMANYRKYGFHEVIAKPFSSAELGRIVHKVLSEP